MRVIYFAIAAVLIGGSCHSQSQDKNINLNDKITDAKPFPPIVNKGDGHEIQITINAYHDSTIYLANYLGDKLYYADTAIVNNEGVAVFEGTEPLPGGKYSIVFPEFKFLQVLIDEQYFSLESDTSHLYKNAKVKDSPNNELFYEYNRFVVQQNETKKKLNKEKDDPNTPDSRVIEIDKLTREADAKFKDELKVYYHKNRGSLFSDIIGMIVNIDVPDAPTDANGVITDSSFQYKYYRDHYFDYTNFKNPNIVRSPEYHKKIDAYFNKTLTQHADSQKVFVDFVMNQIKYNNDIYSYTARYLAANYKRSKYMGMDAGFVHVVQNYFDPDKIIGLEEERLIEAKEEAADMKHTLIGSIAPDIKLHDPSKKFYNLHEIDSPYTLVYIWSPTCDHCTAENPKVVEFQKKMEGKVKVFAICQDQEAEDWNEYLSKYPSFATLLNVSDSRGNRSEFRKLYNSRTTPTIVLLDKDKKVIMKKLGIERIPEFIAHHESLK